MKAIVQYIDAGKVTPAIGSTYPQSETPEALGYLEEGHAQGKTAITVAAAN